MQYVRTATAKGLVNLMCFYMHYEMHKLFSYSYFRLVCINVSGSVFVEYIFGWNGIGKEIVDALNMMDLPVVMGSVLFIASIFVILNIIVDLIYGWLDPRIRYN